MPENTTDRQDNLSEAEKHLRSARSSIDRLKELGVDTADMEKNYSFLKKQISVLRKP